MMLRESNTKKGNMDQANGQDVTEDKGKDQNWSVAGMNGRNIGKIETKDRIEA